MTSSGVLAASPPCCPKCGRETRGAEAACARCGLLRSRFPTFNAKVPPHPVLDPLWSAALADWETSSRHDALAKIAATDWTLLSAVSQRYSAVLRERPGDPIAVRMMDKLIETATSLPLPRTRRTSSGLGRAAKVARALMGVGLLLISFMLAFKVMRR